MALRRLDGGVTQHWNIFPAPPGGPWHRGDGAPARASEVALRLQMEANLGRTGRSPDDCMQEHPEESV